MKREELLDILRERFIKNMDRHPDQSWESIVAKLTDNHIKSLMYMEETGGEPDIVVFDNVLYFCDCSPEAPMRRSLCYDEKARQKRKENKPRSSAEKAAAENGVRILTEKEYFLLQRYGDFDQKTTVWLTTEPDFRLSGTAVFGTKHAGRTFIFYNGAESYYASRGFRAVLKINDL